MEVRFFAGAAEAAGAETLELESTGLTKASLMERLGADNPHLAKVLGVSALLADGVRLAEPDAPLDGTTRLDVLPPFAGG